MNHRDDLEAAIPRPDERMRRALERATELLGDSVEGVGQGSTAEGQPCVLVMVSSRTPELEERVPKSIEGVPVEITETGPFTAGG
jgi:hypothetical protein